MDIAEQNPGNNQQGGDFGITGGSRFNQPDTQNYGGQNYDGQNYYQGYQNYGGGGMDTDDDAIVRHANHDSGSSGDSNLFGNAMGYLKGGNANLQGDVDEDDVMQAHQQAYS